MRNTELEYTKSEKEESVMADAQTHLNSGVTYRKQGKIEDAIAEYKTAISINPNYALAHYNLGNVYREQGELDEAIAEYKVAISINPNYASAHNNLGIADKRQGKLDEAIAEWKIAISINPNHANAHCNLGDAYRHKGMLHDAIAAYKEAIRSNPNHANAHHFLGHAYFDKDMFDEAIGEWKRTIELTPDDARLYKDLRSAYFKAGKLDELIEETEQKLKVDANDARGYYLLALALAEKWEFEQAIDSFRKAIKLNPSYEAAHDDYIELMKSRGRHAEARAEYERRNQAQPDNKLWNKLLESIPATQERFISVCGFCVGRGIFIITYLQFVLLAGAADSIASFASRISFPPLALVVYVTIISAIQTPISGLLFGRMAGMMANKIAGKELRSTKLVGLASGLLLNFVISLKFVPIAVFVYAAMQRFHTNWWVPIAVLSVFFSIFCREFVNYWRSPKEKPLENPTLTERLEELIKRNNVKVRCIRQIDLADNPLMDKFAGVSGVLFPKRIQISSAMLQRLSISEIEAVFAHELGHIKMRAMQKESLLQSILIFFRLYLANLIYSVTLPVYGFLNPEQIAAFPLLAFWWMVLGLPVRIIRSSASRYFEKKADRFALSQVGESAFTSAFSKILHLREKQAMSSVVDIVCYKHPCRKKRLPISE